MCLSIFLMPQCLPEEAQGMIEVTGGIIATLCLALVARKTRKFYCYRILNFCFYKLEQGLHINAQVLNVVKYRSLLSTHHTDFFLAYIFGRGVLRNLIEKVATAFYP